jgi:hypothetical protein
MHPFLSAARESGTSRLPPDLQPLEDETLLSWLLRLTAEWQVSLQTIALQFAGADERVRTAAWWCRPPIGLLQWVSAATGVSIPTLRGMTFGHLEPVYRQDEDSARFTIDRYRAKAPQVRRNGYGFCIDCLETNQVPHLHGTWLIGWLAVCPVHATILITRCAACHWSLYFRPFDRVIAFTPTRCPDCDAGLLTCHPGFGDDSVFRLQNLLLQAKRHGATELPVLGSMTWRETVALIDVLLGAAATLTTFEERQGIARQYPFDGDVELFGEPFMCKSRHESFRFLAWLLDGWPESTGACIAEELLRRGLSTPRNRLSQHLGPRWRGYPWSPGPHDILPEIQHKLVQLLDVASDRTSANGTPPSRPSGEFEP